MSFDPKINIDSLSEGIPHPVNTTTGVIVKNLASTIVILNREIENHRKDSKEFGVGLETFENSGKESLPLRAMHLVNNIKSDYVGSLRDAKENEKLTDYDKFVLFAYFISVVGAILIGTLLAENLAGQIGSGAGGLVLIFLISQQYKNPELPNKILTILRLKPSESRKQFEEIQKNDQGYNKFLDVFASAYELNNKKKADLKKNFEFFELYASLHDAVSSNSKLALDAAIPAAIHQEDEMAKKYGGQLQKTFAIPPIDAHKIDKVQA